MLFCSQRPAAHSPRGVATRAAHSASPHGECAAGTHRCINKGISQDCDDTGIWGDDDECSAHEPALRCESNEASPNYGLCVPPLSTD